jgi:hypothetical protein
MCLVAINFFDKKDKISPQIVGPVCEDVIHKFEILQTKQLIQVAGKKQTE